MISPLVSSLNMCGFIEGFSIWKEIRDGWTHNPWLQITSNRIYGKRQSFAGSRKWIYQKMLLVRAGEMGITFRVLDSCSCVGLFITGTKILRKQYSTSCSKSIRAKKIKLGVMFNLMNQFTNLFYNTKTWYSGPPGDEWFAKKIIYFLHL